MDVTSPAALPLTCEWCLNSPATHLLIWDYRQDGESYSDRHQQAVCGPCAHRQTVLTANFTGWWLFRLVPEDAGKCGEIERSAPVAWPQEQAATAGEEDRERE